MKLPEPERRVTGENIIPLINVVFLLLIFFMLAGTFSRADLFRVKPPTSITQAELDREALVVLLDGERLAVGEETVELVELPRAIEARDKPLPPIHVKADGRTPMPRVMTVLEQLRSAGIEEVELVTRQARE